MCSTWPAQVTMRGSGHLAIIGSVSFSFQHMQNSDLNTEPGEGETVSSTHREVVMHLKETRVDCMVDSWSQTVH